MTNAVHTAAEAPANQYNLAGEYASCPGSRFGAQSADQPWLLNLDLSETIYFL
jgi:hypothetical protein